MNEKRNGIIAIVGCPATGKSVVAEALSKMLQIKHIDYSEYLLRVNAAKLINNEVVIDESKAKFFLNRIDKAIVSGVYALDYLELNKIKGVYVLRCNPKILFYRYLKRNYSFEKIKNNMSSEYLDVCLKMALEKVDYEKVNQVDTSNDEPYYTAMRIYKSIQNGIKIFDKVDWLSQIYRPFDLIFLR